MTEWQKIETAPKDGSVFLGWIGVPWLFFWEEEKNGWCGVVPYRDSYAAMWPRMANVNQPTHWMPLPDKPAD